jgi:hypothetical protein
MARTVLKIAAAAFGELGLTPLSQIAGVQTGDAVLALALLNREGSELADVEGGWPALRGEQTIVLIPGQEAYDFPTDIAYYRPRTIWDRSTHWRVVGPISDREWQRIRSGTNIAGPWMRYRIMDGQIHFDPVPTSADTIVIEYVSANWAQNGAGAAKALFDADTDVPLLPDDLFVLGLKWRLLAARGMNYVEERDTYDKAVARKRPRAEVAEVLQLNRRAPRFSAFGEPNIPDGDWPGP